MSGSKPEVRADLLERLEPGLVLEGQSMGEIRDQLGIAEDDVSATQFGKAVRSLHYKYGQVVYGRIWIDDASQVRGHSLAIR